jgi:hypothetical protein
MYLPKQTCDAIANHLPITYNKDFNLYFWNTQDSAYSKLLSSPHYLAFTFTASSSGNSTINVPLALLNLTLESPLVSTPTQYFPCSPWAQANVANAPYTLGRAFLQAAFLAQNWQTNSLFLAQAPGPNSMSESIKTILSTDSSLAPATNPGDWESTWSSTLKPLSGNSGSSGGGNGNGNGSGGSGKSSGSNNGGISGGAIAGIVVGVVVGIAIIAGLAIWYFLRRRKWARPLPSSDTQQSQPYYGKPDAAMAPELPRYTDPPEVKNQPQYHPVHEAPADVNMVELDALRNPQELDAGQIPPSRMVK